MAAPLRLAVAGLGVHGTRYAEHLLRGDVDGARLVAVSRADAARGAEFAARHGVAFVHDPADLVRRGEVDALVLCLPPDLHPPLALACLDAGKPVLVEKPLGADVAGATAVAQAVERSGGLCMVAHTLRFDPLVRALAHEIPGLGALRLISINQRGEPWDSGWSTTPGRGGVLRITGVHGFDLLRHLSGLEPRSIHVERAHARGRATEDQFVATVRFERPDVLGLIDNSRATESRSGRIEVVGQRAQVWGDHIHRTLVRVEGRSVTDLGPVPAEPTLPLVLSAFVACVREGSPPPVTAADGLAAVRLVESALRSSAG